MTRKSILVAALVLFTTKNASASPLFETAGVVGGSGGFHGMVSDPSAASAYFNPAMLVEADENVLLGFTVLTEQVSLTLDGRRGGDVPLVVGDRGIVGPDGQPIPNTTVPTPWLQSGCPAGSGPGQCPPPGFAARPRQAAGTSGKTRPYLTLGLAKHIIPDRLSVGVYAMLPVSQFTSASTFYSDEREALFSNSLHPELYGDRFTAVSLAFGAGFRLLPGLSVGGGFSIGLTNVATSSTYVVNSTDYSQLLINNDVSSKVALSPYLGVYWLASSHLRIGGAVHGAESFDIDTNINNALPSGTESSAARRNVYDYLPWRLAVGAEADLIKAPSYTMSVVAGGQYEPWSDYVDRQGNSPSIYGPGLAWKDTITWSAGVRHRYKTLRAFLDWQYKPSPVPEQVGRSNYVDNDRVGATFGGDVEMKVGNARLRPGLKFVGYRLIWRHNTKQDAQITDELPDNSVFASTRNPVPGAAGLQTNNPGWPGFGSAGWIYGASVTLEILLP